MFTLCLEKGSDQRYLIGFQSRGVSRLPVAVNHLFDGDFGEVNDCDLVLADDPKRSGVTVVPHHRCQLTSCLRQPSTTEVDWLYPVLEPTESAVAEH